MILRHRSVPTLLAVTQSVNVLAAPLIGMTAVTVPVVLLASSMILATARPAHADVVGRLRFLVKNAADEKGVAGAKIVVTDLTGTRGAVTLTGGTDGTITSAPLQNHAYRIVTTVEGFQTDTREVTVVADVTTDVEILLEPQTEKVVKVTGARNIVRRNDTSSSTRRNGAFAKQFATTAGNSQSLQKALRTTPGFVEDSVNQAHPRGEHAATSIYLNGFLLPGALQGRAGQFLSPESVETFDVKTGGYAPEYGGETAAVLNLTLRSGPLKTSTSASLGGGEFGTFQGDLLFGGQGGSVMPGSAPDDRGLSPRRLGYLVTLSQRNTDNALEPPQPDNQNAHNSGRSTLGFGNFEYKLNTTDSVSFIVNTAPARTEVANRTGLPNRFAPYGQGYGFGGGLSQADAAASGNPELRTQNELGQDIYQKDENTFGLLQYRKSFGTNVNGVFSVGVSDSRLDILNNNPSRYQTETILSSALPDDSSVEYSPTIKRKYSQAQIQGNVTFDRGVHSIKVGGLYADQTGREDYKLIPGSQAALNALYLAEPDLAPTGGTVITDEAGNVTGYNLANGSAVPTVNVKKDGHYAALYVQDTWRATQKFTLNYGLRLDNYEQKQNRGREKVNETELSPRLNAAYALAPRTIARASYNRLVSQPPQAQGSVIGQSLKPQLTNQYEASIEQQIGSNQTVKAAYYDKEFNRMFDTGILIAGTQIGAYTTVSLEKATARGFEFSYDLSPRGGVGPGAFLTYTNSIAKPRGLELTTGNPIEDAYNDHDQRNTLTGGVDYTLSNGASAALSAYYGSGTASSLLYEGAPRQDRYELNLRLSSGDRLFGNGIGADLSIENLTDEKQVINFGSAYSGTRFQQGRRILFSITGRY